MAQLMRHAVDKSLPENPIRDGISHNVGQLVLGRIKGERPVVRCSHFFHQRRFVRDRFRKTNAGFLIQNIDDAQYVVGRQLVNVEIPGVRPRP